MSDKAIRWAILVAVFGAAVALMAVVSWLLDKTAIPDPLVTPAAWLASLLIGHTSVDYVYGRLGRRRAVTPRR